jgi:hypothetical protein
MQATISTLKTDLVRFFFTETAQLRGFLAHPDLPCFRKHCDNNRRVGRLPGNGITSGIRQSRMSICAVLEFGIRWRLV